MICPYRRRGVATRQPSPGGAQRASPSAHIHEASLDRGGGRHGGTHKVPSPAAALAAFEIAVRRRRAALTGTKHVGIHPDTHPATGVSPLEPGLAEDAVQSLR